MDDFDKKNMDLNALTWNLFANSGQIGFYMMNKNLMWEEDMEDDGLLD